MDMEKLNNRFRNLSKEELISINGGGFWKDLGENCHKAWDKVCQAWTDFTNSVSEAWNDMF
jgi:hypothetical protein